ncbi:MAG: hypothetical protein K6U77_04605 [Armatimonadetes bacterium]|nr:hypothetical protein [Armatimonadota bacterium]
MPSTWLQRWRDAYYTENPVVWLLAKTESELCLRQISAPEPAATGSASSRLQLLKSDPVYSQRYFLRADEKEFERTLLAPWHLPSNRWMPVSDQIYLAFASLVTMTALVIHYALAKSPVWVGAVGVGVVVLAFFLPMARPMLALYSLAQTLTADTPLHIGVSRLTPAHLVYGALLYGVGRIARASAVYGILPALLVATIAQGSALRGLPTAILLWGYSVCVGALWILCTLAILYGQATRLYGASRDWVRWQNILALAAGLLGASLLAVSAPAPLPVPALTEWVHTPLWWWGFLPPLGLVSGLAAGFHPLWTLSHIGATLLSIGLGAAFCTRLLCGVWRSQEQPLNAETEGWE